MQSYENEPIVVQREVKAVAIPAGVEVNLKLGSVGYITQALGGSFTVYIDGNLFRIAGQDADAIGKTAGEGPGGPARRLRRGHQERRLAAAARLATTRRSRSTSSTWGWSTNATSPRTRTTRARSTSR